MGDESREEVRTILYVSHNMETIRRLCDRCIVLDTGKIIYDGNACNGVVGGTVDVGGVIGTLITEIVLTCIFVYTILNITDEKAGTGKIAGIVLGLTLTLVHLVGISLTGTSVNPARSIATAFADLIYNGSTEALAQVWMFIVAPLIGAVVSVLLYKAINTEKE